MGPLIGNCHSMCTGIPFNKTMLPKFERSPEFRGFQEIAQNIAQKFCAIFRFMLTTSKTPSKEKIKQMLLKIAQKIMDRDRIVQKSPGGPPQFTVAPTNPFCSMGKPSSNNT